MWRNTHTEESKQGEAPSSSGPKLLYVDGLNYGNVFFDINKSHWSVLEAAEKVKDFVKAATNSGWQLKVFIDASNITGEAVTKWKQRRETEVIDEVRAMPHGMSTLLGDAFKENGIEVFYSVEADNDDTLAAYASRDNATILSGDRDFFRYRGLTCPIYGKFEINSNRLHLIKLNPNFKERDQRDIISPPPEVITGEPALSELKNNMYRRGAPSPLVKRIGNIHVICRPLRQALYARKGVKGSVLEIFPVWQGNKVVWLEDHIHPDNKLDHLLDDPNKAMEAMFPDLATLVKPEDISDKNWENHLYAMHAVVYELCMLGNKNGTSLLQMLRPTILKFIKDHPQLSMDDLSKFGKLSVSENKNQSKPAYESECKGCKTPIKLSQKEVEFFNGKGFDMPKWCKECRQPRSQITRKKIA